MLQLCFIFLKVALKTYFTRFEPQKPQAILFLNFGLSKANIRDFLIYAVKSPKDISRNRNWLSSHRHLPGKIDGQGEVAITGIEGFAPTNEEACHLQEINRCWVVGKHSQAERQTIPQGWHTKPPVLLAQYSPVAKLGFQNRHSFMG